MRKRKSRTVRRVLVVVVLFAILIIGTVVFVNRYYPVRYSEIVHRYAEKYDLEPALVFAVINAESGFRSNAVSRSGASGLMQIMEDTAYWLAPQIPLDNFSYDQIFDPEINIQLGTFYLSTLRQRYGNLEVALSAYNAGSGNVRRWLDDPDFSSDGETLDHIPFPETRKYVERVNENMQIYSLLLRFLGIFSGHETIGTNASVLHVARPPLAHSF